jgi:hypothetical protein
MKNSIFHSYPVTNQEYFELDRKFGQLAHFQAWQLIKKNSKNNHTDEEEDVAQEMVLALLRAGSYYKRQTYIEKCLDLCDKHINDPFMKQMVEVLQDLWKNKTKHGASRQKFGPIQEKILDRLAKKIPASKRPSKKAPLQIDAEFNTYCKSITWNQQKTLGKKITREKSIRHGMASLSEHDHLASELISM